MISDLSDHIRQKVQKKIKLEEIKNKNVFENSSSDENEPKESVLNNIKAFFSEKVDKKSKNQQRPKSI